MRWSHMLVLWIAVWTTLAASMVGQETQCGTPITWSLTVKLFILLATSASLGALAMREESR